MKFLYTIILLALSFSIFSQRGKDGPVTITGLNTIVNAYTPVTADANAGTTIINVVSSAGFNVGDLIMIIQMQGARVNAQWDTVYVDPNNSMSVPNSNNLSYGAITDYHNAGNNEFAEISSIPNGTSIVVDCGLKNAYTFSYTNNQGGSNTMFGHIQVIKVPRYSSLTINAGGSITCPQWNGTTGGIAVVEIENNAALNNTPSFNVSGKGFRGGIKDNATSVFGGNKWGALNQNQGGYKGESIFADTTTCKPFAALIARGAIANGGGGGDAHNAGGGGGANGGNIAGYNGYGNPSSGYNAIWNLEGGSFSTNTSSGGGRGGYTFSNMNRNANTTAPGLISTASNTWGGDMRRNAGGLGGRPLDYSTGRIYLGGGGGAGDGNENQAGAGGNGGGLVYVVCYGNLSGAGTIVADGANGSNTTPGCGSNDGGGGGGGGGTIILKVNGTIGLTAAPALSAVGGNGGNVNFNCVTTNYDGYGPGGSGGGGYIASTGALPSNNIAAGNNGIQSGNGALSANSISSAFPPNGATKGGAGSTGSVTAYTLTASANQTLCANQAFTVSATSTEPATTIYWYTTQVSGTPVASGTTYAAPGYPTAGTYTLFAGVCGGTYRQPVIITVTNGLSMSVAGTNTICPGQSTTLTASGATTYTWVSGPTTNTISVSPASTTVYTVNGTSGLCSGTQTVNVTVSPTPTLSVAGTSICSGNSTTLTVASSATSFTWMPGGQTTSSIAVTPTINITYTVTGSNGACSNTTTATVNVTSTPTLVTSPSTICAGQVATFTVSGALSYTWNPGNVTGSTFTLNPASSTTVSVIGANGTCTSQTTTSLTVTPSPVISVASQTICPGQSTVLTANGATTYTWVSGPATNTISVSPASTTVYTVNGTANACTGSGTATVTIGSVPSLTLSGNSFICSGGSTTITASGASSYTWAPGGELTPTVSVSPSSTTGYTVTGSNGTCTNTITTTVTVAPTPTLTANSVTICPGQTATLTVSGAATFTWMPGNITGSSYTIAPSSNTFVTVTGANGSCTSQATPSVTIGTGISIGVNSPTICAGQTATLTASGATTYTWDSGAQTNTLTVNPASTTVYTISGSAGTCTGSSTSTVTVLNLPAISVTGNTAICSGNPATLTASGATSYTWASGGQLTASVSVNPAADVTYTVTGFDGACTNTTTVDVTVTPTPILTANPVSICAGQTATLTVSGATTYTWNPGNVTGDTYTASPASSSAYTVVGANGTCTSQVTTSVTVGSAISIAVNNPTICAGQSVVLTPTSTATSYTWDSGSQTNTLSVSPTTNTVYTVSGSNGTCVGTGTAMVTVNPVPTLNAASNNICNGQTATLTATGANTYTWSNGNNNSTQTVNPSTTTVYTVNGTSMAGCTNTAIATTTVIVTAVPVVTANIATICAGQTATLTASGANSYTWSTVEFTGTINPTPVNTTTYSVIGTNGGCNSLPFSTTVTVSQSPTLTINALNTSGCAPLCVNFTDATSSSCSTITYNFGDGNTGNTNNPNHCFNTSGNYTVTATCTNTLGCSSTYTLPSAIQVIVTPVADFTISEGDIVTVGSTVNLTNTSSNALLYGWDYCNGISTATNITTSYADTGSCCITLLASNATCTNSVTKCITVVNEAVVIIPNVFTPNGDTKNDIFRINTVGIKDLSCGIYDRWGLKLFEWNGINGGWDGSVKSAMAPDGTYFYILNYTDQKGESKTEKGFLSLFKD